MKQVLGFLSIVCMAGFLLGGCSTILNGSTQKINVATEGGKKYAALVDGVKYDVPAVIEVKRENKDKIISLQECPDQKTLLHKEVSGTFFVNILSGGAFGSTTDYASGDMWKYEPDNVTVKCP